MRQEEPENEQRGPAAGEPEANQGGPRAEGTNPDWNDLSWLDAGSRAERRSPEISEQEPGEFPLELDPGGPAMAHSHQHEAYRTAPRRLGGRAETCRCGSYRDVGLVAAGNWAGGEPGGTPWEGAHLEAVRMAVEENPLLTELQPRAIRNLNEIIRKDPPPEAERQQGTWRES